MALVLDNSPSATTTGTNARFTLQSGISGTVAYAFPDIGFSVSRRYLTTDGTNLSLTAGTDWAPTGITASAVTSPINTASIAVSGGTTIQQLALVPLGSGGYIAGLPDGTKKYGNSRGKYSIDLQSQRYFPNEVCDDASSIIMNGKGNRITFPNSVGRFNVILNGEQNYITGGSGNVILNGLTNKIQGGDGAGSYGWNTILNGINCLIKADGSGGAGDRVSYCIVTNGVGVNSRNQFSVLIHGGPNFGDTTTSGSAKQQVVWHMLGVLTANATPVYLMSNTESGTTPNSHNSINMPSTGGVVQVYGVITASLVGGAVVSSWYITNGLYSYVSPTISTVAAATVTRDFNDASASGWVTPSVVINSANGSLDIQVTGVAATNIQWNAYIATVEVGL